jgi:hypothetical protein
VTPRVKGSRIDRLKEVRAVKRVPLRELRDRAARIGFRIEKVRGEDRYLIRYGVGGGGTPGNLAPSPYQNATYSQLLEWLA